MLIDTERKAALERLRPYVERAHSFSGWSFDDLDMRHLEPGPPWDYEVVVREQAPRRGWALDMGTGGGEVLSRLRDGLPEHVVATEEWHVNAPVAYRRLAPIGVDLVRCRSLCLPFADASFDLVIDRHEELAPAEVARVLRSGGRIVTQQVGRENWRELRPYFSAATAGHRSRLTDFGDIRGAYARVRIVGADRDEE